MRYWIYFFYFLFITPVFAAEIDIGHKVVYDVQVAKTKEQQQQGLMFVRHLEQSKGMLFDFRGYDDVSMWMKNTYIPLDMLFLDCQFRVVDIYQDAKPMSEEAISSDERFCYVLEINAGEVKSQDIQIGDKAQFVDDSH